MRAPHSYAAPAPQSYAPPSAFVRQAAQTPYGYTQGQQQQYYRNDLSAPPPPHSLAPMAMSADSTNRQFSTTGVSHHTHGSTMSGRDKPSLKWGIMIALSGALLGGVLGLGMDARRQSARAAAAAEAANAAPAVVATALPVAQPVQPVVIAPRVVAPAALPGAALAVNALAAPAPVAPPAAPPPVAVAAAPAAPAPIVLAAAPAVVVPKGAVVHSKPFVKPHGFLAAKVTQPTRPAPEPKADAPETKTAKVEKTETPKPAKKDANTSDAMKILEAANKDTTNTL